MTPDLAELVEAFGPEILNSEGSLDRAALAGLMSAIPDDAVMVHDVPLLVEVGLQDAYDLVLVVDAPDEIRLQRLVDRGLSRSDAHARIAAQATREQCLAVADVVLDYSGSLEELREVVDGA